MKTILYYFLPAIIALGIITSYEDIKFGKIRNKWVVAGLVYALLVNILIVAYYSLQGTIRTHYLIELATNLLFGIIIGFGFWLVGIWSAADGKLFIAFTALIPLSTYKYGYQEWIPSLTLLINIFIPALAILFVWMLIKVKKKHVRNASVKLVKETLNPKELLKSAINLFAIYWVVDVALLLINLNNNQITKMMVVVGVYSLAQKKFRDKMLYVSLILSIVRLSIDKTIYSTEFFINFLILIFVWRILRSFLSGSISRLGQEVFTKTAHISKLSPGTLLAETIEQKKSLTKLEFKTLKKTPDTRIIKHKGFYYIKRPKSSIDLNNFLGEEAEGLTKEQINQIKKLGIKQVKISETIPFAQFIFLGTILTIILNGNILILVSILLAGGG